MNRKNAGSALRRENSKSAFNILFAIRFMILKVVIPSYNLVSTVMFLLL